MAIRAHSIVTAESPPPRSALSVTCVYSYAHYQQISEQFRTLGEYERRRRIEEALLTGEDNFSVPGYCYVTSRYTEFTVNWDRASQKTGKWRESLVSAGMYNNRTRASIHLFEMILRPRPEDTIYITEQYSPLYRWLKKKYPHTIGSEHLGCAVAPGKMNEDGIRNESLTSLSFPDQSMQFVLSFDCFEHFSDYKTGLSECVRILKPGGSLLITVPFHRGSACNIVRAKDVGDGSVQHLLPPEYHSDPLNKQGCLCYYHFGWELLDDMRRAGFRNPRAYLYWSREYGYLGIEQILFCADR